MLSYEKCIELRDNGFPQPDFDPQTFWWRKRFGTGEMVLCVTVEVHDEKGRYMVASLPIDSENSPLLKEGAVYCPTVEDMLSMLYFGYTLTRTAEGNWSIVDLNAKTILYLEKTPLEVLYEAFVDRRYLFEKSEPLVFACPPKPKTEAELMAFLYRLARFIEPYPYLGNTIKLSITPLKPGIKTREILAGGKKFMFHQGPYVNSKNRKEWCTFHSHYFDIIFALEDV